MRLVSLPCTVAVAMLVVPSSAWAAPPITEFPTGSNPVDVTAGPDGNVWIVEQGANKIGRVTPSGTLTEFSTGLTAAAGLTEITAGPDGNLWFTENNADRIGKITPTGTITEYPAGGGTAPHGIVAGPDGNVWFTQFGGHKIGKITTSGVVTSYTIPGANSPWSIAAGPDGNLWFTDHTASGAIGRVTTIGSVTEFGLTSASPSGIAAGPDGNLWFADSQNPGSIGRVSPTGTITPFSSGLTTNSDPVDLVAADDGNLYFTEGVASGHQLGQITPSGVITELTTSLVNAPLGITAGPDGNLWFVEGTGNRIGRLTLAPVVTTNAATAIGASGANLAGSVTPNSQATTYSFDWGLTSAYGTSTATSAAGAGAAPQAVTASITGLAPFTTYHFRIVATNGTGTTVGADRTFTTAMAPAAVTTGAASAVDETNAMLTAVVNPNGVATTYHFELGSGAGYGNNWPAADATAGSDGLPHALQQPVTGLIPGQTYHYRAVATNAAGVSYGADQTFTTLSPAPAPSAGLPPATTPIFGQSATLVPVSGTVLVQLPKAAGYLPLEAASTVPVGSTINATAGTVRLTNVRDRSGKLQTGTFWGGSFTVHQTRLKQASTVLTLATPLGCARSLTSLAAKPPRARQLWGRDNHGKFVTRGRTAVATVRGTVWLLRDTCAGTLVKVTRGTVSVRDLVRHRTVVVTAGHSYLARRR